MKNNFLYRSIAFMLAFVVLFTSTGFAMDMHFCQNELKSVSFFGEAESCHMNASEECPNHQAMAKHTDESSNVSIDRDDCCHNETILVESDNDLVSMDFVDLSTHQVYFLVAYAHHFITPIFVAPTTEHYFNLAAPPPPERDFQVLFQSFLI